jgi:regulator of nucleoside diphosphate kinase
MNSNRSIIVTDSDIVQLRTLDPHTALADELEYAKVVPATGVPPDVVTMNSRVRFEDMTSGETREITIVFPRDADASHGRVSVLAPVGTALLGLAEGDAISWPFPDGRSRRLRVVEIMFQPEANDVLARAAQPDSPARAPAK